MALPDVTASRLGQANATASAVALFLEQYSGLVLVSFQNAVKFIDRTYMREIMGTNAAQFPIFADDGEAYYHTPGTMIDPKVVKQNAKTITADDLLIAPRFVARID